MSDVAYHPLSTQCAASPELAALYAKECQSCGVCCIGHCGAPFNIPIKASDSLPPRKYIQIGPRVGNRNKYVRIRPLKVEQWQGSCCAALEGEYAKDMRCAIYDDRPTACRNYDPGSPACLWMRKWAGFPILDDGYGHS